MTDRRVVLVTGASGQLGGALAKGLDSQAAILSRTELDFASPEPAFRAKAEEWILKTQPHACINAAAMTAVDAAEAGEGRALAEAVNAAAPGVLADICAKHGVPFLHVSTDYVFDGSGMQPRREDEVAHPLNYYGETKLDGERRVTAAGGKYLIFRTSWVFDATHKNFVTTMLKLAAEREELKVVDDQIGAPTYAAHLAFAIVEALEQALCLPAFPSGIYHCAAAGETSWHGFAEHIIAEARAHGKMLKVKHILPILSADYPQPARRPHNSRLDCAKLADVLNVHLPSWQEGLAACMKERYAHQ